MIRETLICTEGLQVKREQLRMRSLRYVVLHSISYLGTQVQDDTQDYTNKNNDGSAHIFFKLN